MPKTTSSSASPDNVNLGTFTRVHLSVYAKTLHGETIHISGSSFSMGQYNPSESTLMVTSPSTYPIWRTLKPLILQCGIPHHYMYAKFSGGLFSSWEKIEIDRMIVPQGKELRIIETYNVYDENMEMEEHVQEDGHMIVYTRKAASTDTSDTASKTSEDYENEPLVRNSSQHFPLKVKAAGDSGYTRFHQGAFTPQEGSVVLLVAYHLPVIVRQGKEGWEVEWNLDSSIAKTEKSIAEDAQVYWIGCLTQAAYADIASLSEGDWDEIETILWSMRCSLIKMDAKMTEQYYMGYCKSYLWPIFHNVDVLDICSAVWKSTKWTLGGEEENAGLWWVAYQTVNDMFADHVWKLMEGVQNMKECYVWVHDYHLLLLSTRLQFIAECEPTRIQPQTVFFLHVPFPTSEIFRALSNGPELLEGMLSVQVVGFHSFDHARHFLNACKRFLGLSYQSRRGGNLGVEFKGRNVVVTISHIGIETEFIGTCLTDPVVHRMAGDLKAKYPGKILICGVDACQRLSGIPLKMLAFEQFITNFPIWRDKIVLVQRSTRSHSRLGDQEYSSAEIRQLVDRITKQHGPVIDYEEVDGISRQERLALWLACPIMFHSAIRGGLNLLPLEYVFSREENAGVVILSEFSACCCVLNGALRINPWNLLDTMGTLDQALVMSVEERQARRTRDLNYLTKKTAANWTRQVLSVVQESRDSGEEQLFTDMEPTVSETGRSHTMRFGESTDFMRLDPEKLLKAYSSTCRRLFLLDYGGTIIARENMSMYVKKDFTAVTGRKPSPKMLAALRTLTNDPKNTVFVISGVSQVNLTAILGDIPGLSLAAQSGTLWSWADVEMQSDDAPRYWDHAKVKCDDWITVKSIVEPILNSFRSRTNGSTVQIMEQGMAWNYRSTDPEWGLMQASQLEADLNEVLKDYPVIVVRKKGLVEIVPEGVHKGSVAKTILSKQSIRGPPDFIFCAGDDTTDETMFKAIYEYMAERSDESVHGPPAAGGGSESAIQHVFTCTVGKKPSNAHLYVDGVADVEELLSLLAPSSISP